MIRCLSFSLLLALIPTAAANDAAVKGQRVFTVGHSFHIDKK